MAYTKHSRSLPSGGAAGTQVPVDARANDNAVLDGAAFGLFADYVFSVTVGAGTAEQPQYLFWKNGATWLRATITWGTTGGEAGNIKQIVADVSINSGSDYTTAPGGNIGTVVCTYDANGNLTSTTGGGSMLLFVAYLLGRHKTLWALVSAHASGTGAAVHGLGTMSTQSAAAVAITGGSASLAYEREVRVAKGNVSSSTAIDWAAGGLQTITVTGAGATLTHSNLPNGVVGYVTLDVTNGGLATSLLTGCKFAGAVAPTFTNPGRDVVSLMCHDGSIVSVVGFIKDVR